MDHRAKPRYLRAGSGGIKPGQHIQYSLFSYDIVISLKKKIEPLLTSEGKNRDQGLLSGQHVNSADRNQGLGRKRVLSHMVPINLRSAVERTSLCVDIAFCGAAVIFH